LENKKQKKLLKVTLARVTSEYEALQAKYDQA